MLVTTGKLNYTTSFSHADDLKLEDTNVCCLGKVKKHLLKVSRLCKVVFVENNRSRLQYQELKSNLEFMP